MIDKKQENKKGGNNIIIVKILLFWILNNWEYKFLTKTSRQYSPKMGNY